MMTGQILGGSDPAVAARYQIIVMFLIGAATGLSSGACAANMVCSQQGAAAQPALHALRSCALPGTPMLGQAQHCPPTAQQQVCECAASLLCPAVATILLAVLSLIDDKHRLRSERLQPRANTAKGAVAWLGAQAAQVGLRLASMGLNGHGCQQWRLMGDSSLPLCAAWQL